MRNSIAGYLLLPFAFLLHLGVFAQSSIQDSPYRDSTVVVTTEGDVMTRYVTYPCWDNVGYSRHELSEDPYLTDPMLSIEDVTDSGRPVPFGVSAAIVQPDNSYAVGKIPYFDGISSTGARTYTIPIAVAPAVPFVPELSLCYNSQSGDGIAGYGWNIGGLSSILLMGKTMYWHGKVEAASVFDTAPAFCLDGIPIVRTSIEGLSSVYKYETARGHILVNKHLSSDKVQYFDVLYPDGSKAVYGFKDNTAARVSYPLTEITDIQGNKMTFEYGMSNNVYYPTEVRYNYDKEGNSHSRIVFSYSAFGRHETFYAGVSVANDRLLTGIDSYDGTELLYSYNLEHTSEDYARQLVSVGCSSGKSSLNPLRFTYGEGISGQADFCNRNGTCYLEKSFTDVDVLYVRGKFRSGHYSDGLIILPSLSTYTKTATYVKKFLGIKTAEYFEFGSGYSPDQSFVIVPSVGSFSRSMIIKAESGFQAIEAIDVDDDGTDEIVKVNFNGIEGDYTKLRVKVYKFNETATRLDSTVIDTKVYGVINDGDKLWSPQQRQYIFGKFDERGGAQLLSVSYNKDFRGNARQSYTTVIDLKDKSSREYVLFDLGIQDAKKFLPFDIDNDGKTELCYATASGLDQYKYYPGGTFRWSHTIPGFNSSVLSGKFFFTDMNGDGLLDIVKAPMESYYETTYPGYDPSSGEDMRDYAQDNLVCGGTEWEVYSYTGNRFYRYTCKAISNDPGDKFMFLDINRDGLADLIRITGTEVAYYINNLGVIRNDNEVVSSLKYPAKSQLVPANVLNYNNASQFIIVNGFEVNGYEFSGDRSRDRLLTVFEDSFGVTHVNTYSNMLSASGVYQHDSGRSYTLADGYSRRSFPLNLLYSTETYLTPSRKYSERLISKYFTYFDAVCHSRGLGFCGFGKTRVIDNIGNTMTVQEYYPEKSGVPTHSIISLRTPGNPLVSETENTYDNNSTTYGKLNPRLILSVSTDHLTGIVVETSTTYGDYDYPSSVMVNRRIGSGKAQAERIDYTYLHSIKKDCYRLGAVKQEARMRSNTSVFTAVSWKERTEITYDDCFRPIVRKLYVGEKGGEQKIDRPLLPVGIVSLSDYIDTPFNPDTTKLNPIDQPDPLKPFLPSVDDILELFSETHWEYDSYGNMISEKSAPHGIQEFTGMTYTYDAEGRYLSSKTDRDGRMTGYESYDRFGNPTKTIDYMGNSSCHTYDDWGHVIATVYPDGTVVRTKYDWGGIGNYTITTSSDIQSEKIVHYDAIGRELRKGVKCFDGQWRYIDNVYNSKGKLEKTSLPFRGTQARFWTVYAYDDYGRAVSVTEASGKVTSWAYNGCSVTETKNGMLTTRTTDANGNIVSVTDPGGTITYSLRPDGQPSSVTVPGHVVTSFFYDTYGRKKKVSDPSVGTYTDSLVWNADGSSVVVRTNPNGKVITYFDKHGRTTKVERPGEYNTIFSYDGHGHLIREESTNGTGREIEYDIYGRIRSMKEIVPDGKWLKKTFVYGAGNLLNTVSYESQSGKITAEVYGYSNGHNTDITLSDGTIVKHLVSENDLGQPTAITTGDVLREYGYSSFGLPTYRRMDGGDLQDFQYAFDANTGNLLMRQDDMRGLTESFGYDQMNRLVSMSGRGIEYQANGNISSIDGVGTMAYSILSRPYQITQLTPVSDDAVPNRTQRISYTCYSRPSILQEGGRSAAFTYNGDGDRVKMYVADGAASRLTRYYIGGQYELDLKGGVSKERLYLGGDAYSSTMVLERTAGGAWTPYNIGRDYLGNITHIATLDGGLVAEYSYDPWGRLRDPETQEIYRPGEEPELFLGRGYTGHEHLPWFGLINMNARLYDPLLGRFLSPDPYVQMPDFTQNFNRYSYCLNNPLAYVDESGEIFGTAITFIYDFFRTLFTGGLNGNDEVRKAAWQRYDPTASWSKTNKAWEIAKGSWMTDKGKPWYEQVYSVCRRWTFEIVQTFAGKVFSHASNMFDNVTVSYYHEATVINRNDSKKGGWGMTLGSYINTMNKDEDLLRHEYGHVLQSQRLGFVFIDVVGIPSLIGCALEGHEHNREWYETWANQLSYDELSLYHMDELNRLRWNENEYSRKYNLDWYFGVTIAYYILL
ncbi:MAG: hypothetical protein K2O58_09990 [Bacteroidales bacterium]|nr:hypothetical protein [Bacteroidales bacterium]